MIYSKPASLFTVSSEGYTSQLAPGQLVRRLARPLSIRSETNSSAGAWPYLAYATYSDNSLTVDKFESARVYTDCRHKTSK